MLNFKNIIEKAKQHFEGCESIKFEGYKVVRNNQWNNTIFSINELMNILNFWLEKSSYYKVDNVHYCCAMYSYSYTIGILVADGFFICDEDIEKNNKCCFKDYTLVMQKADKLTFEDLLYELFIAMLQDRVDKIDD